MFIIPLLVWENGFFTSPFLNHKFIRFLPLAIVFTFTLVTLSKTQIRKTFISAIPVSLVGFCLVWIIVTILPHMPHPLMFEHATRYLLFPMVGFSVLFGVIFAAFLNTAKDRWGTAGLVLTQVLFLYIVLLNLAHFPYHYGRYQAFLREHPKYNYSDRVLALMNSNHEHV